MPKNLFNSKDPKITKHLNDMIMFQGDMFLIIIKLREMILGLDLNMNEKVMYGGIMFTLGDVKQCSIYASKKHVSIEFGKGYMLENKNDALEGVGHTRRHIKLFTIDDIENKDISFFLNQLKTI